MKIVMKPTIYDAVKALVGSGLSIKDNTFESIAYHNNQTPPTKKQAEDKLAKMQEEYDAQEYARKRQAEYPSIGDQMDMIYKDMKNGTSTHADAVEVVKTKYPKG